MCVLMATLAAQIVAEHMGVVHYLVLFAVATLPTAAPVGTAACTSDSYCQKSSLSGLGDRMPFFEVPSLLQAVEQLFSVTAVDYIDT